MAAAATVVIGQFEGAEGRGDLGLDHVQIGFVVPTGNIICTLMGAPWAMWIVSTLSLRSSGLHDSGAHSFALKCLILPSPICIVVYTDLIPVSRLGVLT